LNCNKISHQTPSSAQVCEHCSYRNAKEYQWQNKTIILAADYASNGIYNFIIPLRAHFRSKTSLNPIILLLERRPDIAFLDAISYFPLVSLISDKSGGGDMNMSSAFIACALSSRSPQSLLDDL
jgi:hypothetical protein